MPPVVSVIIPNYNYARYLEARIQSVLEQDFQDFELILLDDASTDNSTEIIERYRNNPKVSHIVINEHNTGSPFAQWQRGIELARGKYIWIAEADDLAKPEFLSASVKALNTNPDAALSFTGADVIDGAGEKSCQDFDYYSWNDHSGSPLKVYDGQEYITRNMYWSSRIYNASGAVFLKSAVKPRFLAESAKMRNSGDWLFWVKIASTGKIVEIHRKLNAFRIHGANTTSNGEKNGTLRLEDIIVISYIEENFHIPRYKQIVRHGTFLKELMRSDIPADKKQEIIATARRMLGATMWDYRIERLNKLLLPLFPQLPSIKSDRF